VSLLQQLGWYTLGAPAASSTPWRLSDPGMYGIAIAVVPVLVARAFWLIAHAHPIF